MDNLQKFETYAYVYSNGNAMLSFILNNLF